MRAKTHGSKLATLLGGRRAAGGSIVVITHGANPVVVIPADGSDEPATTVQTFPARPIEPQSIVDTTGAGDSFAAGFLASLVKQRCRRNCEVDVKACAELGATASWHTLQRSGFDLGSDNPAEEHVNRESLP